MVAVEPLPVANRPLAPDPVVTIEQRERTMSAEELTSTPALSPTLLLWSVSEEFPEVEMREPESV